MGLREKGAVCGGDRPNLKGNSKGPNQGRKRFKRTPKAARISRSWLRGIGTEGDDVRRDGDAIQFPVMKGLVSGVVNTVEVRKNIMRGGGPGIEEFSRKGPGKRGGPRPRGSGKAARHSRMVHFSEEK